MVEFYVTHGRSVTRSPTGRANERDEVSRETEKMLEIQARRAEKLDLARERKGRRARAHQWRPPTLIYRSQNGRPSALHALEISSDYSQVF